MYTKKQLIKQIERHRNSVLISYIGSTRIGADYPMQQFDIRVINNHLRKIGKTPKIDLLLHSFGGDVTFPWRLVNLIREYADEFHVIIPLHAFSAATLTSLGADSITMLAPACLGPTDPAANSEFNPRHPIEQGKTIPINTEDVAYFTKFIKDDLGITSESGIVEALKILSNSDNRVHPIALGHAKRGSKLAEKYARELLTLHMRKKSDTQTINKIVKTFGSELYAHDHPINRKEAKELGLKIIDESPIIEEKIWDLFSLYENEMELNIPFDPIAEFKKIQPSIPLSLGQNINAVQHTLPACKLVIIESRTMADTLVREVDVTGIKLLDQTGSVRENYSFIGKAVRWEKI